MGKNGNMWPFQVPKQIANAENTDQSEVTWCMNFFETKKGKQIGKEWKRKKQQQSTRKYFYPDHS